MRLDTRHPILLTLDFDLFNEVKWLDEILDKEGIENPVIIGQSMGGYLGRHLR